MDIHIFKLMKTRSLINIFIVFFLPFSTFSAHSQLIPDLPLPPLPLIPELLNFLDQRLAIVYPIIQTFKNTIILDPLGITNTWVGSDICKYKGFFCDNPPDNLSATTVASIDFNGFHLSAPTLDGFIDQLPDLAIFHANSNNFSGTISSKISNLPYLYELDLSNNDLAGVFPAAVLRMKSLYFLDIRFNSFTGTVPPEIFMKDLGVLFLNNNNFMQNLPANIGDTPAVFLTLANNHFTGQIPPSIGDASTTLTEVLLLNNQLTGCLPYEIGFLKELRLLDAGNNLLTGPLPCSLGCLWKIEQLNLAGNLLYGRVPEIICRLGNLMNLSLSGNYFTGVGPICRRLIKSGVLDARGNCVRDLPDQRPAGECLKFFLQRKVCPRPTSFSIIPCSGNTVNLHDYKRGGSGRRSEWVTYNTLTRHL